MNPKSFLQCIQALSFEYQKLYKEDARGKTFLHTYYVYHCVKKMYPRVDIRVSPSICISTFSKEIYPQSLVIWLDGEKFFDVNYETWKLYNKHYYECLSEIPKQFKLPSNMKKLFYEYVDLANKINSGHTLEEDEYYIKLATFCTKTWKELNG